MRKLLICLVGLLVLPTVVLAQSPFPLTSSGLPAPCKSDTTDVYLIVNSTRRHIVDWTTFLSLGYKQSDIVSCGAHTNDRVGEPITNLIKGSGPEIYWVLEGKRQHIPDMDTFYTLNFKISDVTVLPDEMVALWPLGEPLASENTAANLPVACTIDAHTVYLLIDGKRRPVVDADTLQNLGYKPPDVQPCGPHASDPEGDTVTNILKGSSADVYWVFGHRYLIPDMDTFVAAGLKVKDITTLPDKILGKWPLNDPLTSVHVTPGGGMYKQVTVGEYTIQLYHAIYFRSPDGFAIISAPNRHDMRIEGIEGLVLQPEL